MAQIIADNATLIATPAPPLSLSHASPISIRISAQHRLCRNSKKRIGEKIKDKNMKSQWKLVIKADRKSNEFCANELERWALAHHYVLAMSRTKAGIDCDRFRGLVVARTMSGRIIEVEWNSSLKSGWVSVQIVLEKNPTGSLWITEQVIPALENILKCPVDLEVTPPAGE